MLHINFKQNTDQVINVMIAYIKHRQLYCLVVLLRGPLGPHRIVISEFSRMHSEPFNLRMRGQRGCPQASNISDDPTSKY
jgi:hypothetical protein